MPVITLPDGSQRAFENPVTTLEVAQDIGPGLAKATIAGRVNGERVDACDLITEDANLQIITQQYSEVAPRMLPGYVRIRVCPSLSATPYQRKYFSAATLP